MPYDNLTTVASLKAWLRPTGNNDDAEFATLITVASDLIGRFCGRDNLGKVYTYTENYFRSGSFKTSTRQDLSLVLRHYPIVSLVSVAASGNSSVPILDQAALQSNQAGVFVQEDVEPRMLKFRFLQLAYPITVTYTAGYAFNLIPMTLAQACNQVAAEIFRSSQWVGLKSISMAGETTSYDAGEAWGMSKRTQAMLQPYRDVVPFRYF